ncbi:hypothetical protein BD779DRAFT_1668426 [Infundibulicybe gibba]|nr:hypothetical protein BD779DRAFT_1668426 [Infundibulicybe gibba]
MKYLPLFLFNLISAVLAVNDWSKPCHSGVCSYDIPATAGGPSGTLKIWGSPISISDITPASGWEIIDCSPDALAQNIRLFCRGRNTAAAGCSHLFYGIRAVGKIVRLPESCGKNAFARVAKAWVSADQSIPAFIAARVPQSDSRRPLVRGLTIDTNFGEVDPSKTGIVTFAIQGATIPGAAGDIPAPALESQRRIRSILGVLSGLSGFDTNKSTALPPLDVDKTFNLLTKTVSCPPITASLKIDVGAKAHALASIGIAASGTFIPPKISSFGIISSVTADLEGSIDLVADVSGTFDSGLITLFEVGIPGLDFPGILSIGPNFQINAEAAAVLDLNVDLNVGVNFHVSNAQMRFPPSSSQRSTGAFRLGDIPLKLFVSPSVKATGGVEAHIIPRLNIGINAFGRTVSANAFLNLDASAKMTLGLEAVQAGATQKKIADLPGINVAHGKQSIDMDDTTMSPSTVTISSGMLPTNLKQKSTEPHPGDTSIHWAVATHPAKSAAPSLSVARKYPSALFSIHSNAASISPPPSYIARSSSPILVVSTPWTILSSQATPSSTTPSPTSSGVSVTPSASASQFRGCFNVSVALDVNAGATGSFPGLSDATAKLTLFSKSFDLFKKCFGSQSVPVGTIPPKTLVLSLTCPEPDVGAPILVTDNVVKAV